MSFGRLGQLGLGTLGAGGGGSVDPGGAVRPLFRVGGTSNWPTAANWSLSSGGAGGEPAPDTNDTATLDGASSGGTVTMTGAVSVASITFGAFTGTLTTGSQTVTAQSISGSGTGTRTFNISNSTLNITGTGSVWTFTTTTNLTFTSTSSTINITGNGARTVNFGAITYATVNVTGTGVVTSGNQNATFGNLSRVGSAIGDGMMLGNFTITGTLTVSGPSTSIRTSLTTSATGTNRTVTAAAAALSNTDIANLTFTNPTTGTSLGDLGGNANVTFPAAKDVYWVGNGGSLSDATTHCALSTGGAPGAANFPLPQDRLLADANSFTSIGQTFTIDVPRIGGMDWSAVTNTPTIALSASYAIYGSFIVPVGSGAVLMTGNVTGTIGNQSGTLDIDLDLAAIHLNATGFPGSITQTAPGGTVRLLSHFQCAGLFTINSGTFTANNFDLQYTFFRSIGTSTRTLNMGSGTWLSTSNGVLWDVTATGMTLNAGTSTIKFFSASSPSRTFNGGGLTYYNFLDTNHDGLLTDAPLIITGANTFNEFRIDSSDKARTVTFPAGATNTIASFVADGRAGALLTLQSSSAGSPATISSAGTNTVSFMLIKDITFTGAGSLTASNSTNGGGNTGITFV